MSSEPRTWKRGDAEPVDDPMVIDREGLAWGQLTNGGWGSPDLAESFHRGRSWTWLATVRGPLTELVQQ